MDLSMTNIVAMDANLLNIENRYYEMARRINASDSIDEIINSITNALKSLVGFVNTELPINNFMVYNILLVAKLFIRKNKAKYYLYEPFIGLERLMRIFENEEKKEETTPKR